MLKELGIEPAAPQSGVREAAALWLTQQGTLHGKLSFSGEADHCSMKLTSALAVTQQAAFSTAARKRRTRRQHRFPPDASCFLLLGLEEDAAAAETPLVNFFEKTSHFMET